MDRDMAAYYCGLSPNTFEDRVQSGTMPKPHREGRRLLWDLRELDRALGDDPTVEIDTTAAAESQSEKVAAAEAAALAAISGR